MTLRLLAATALAVLIATPAFAQLEENFLTCARGSGGDVQIAACSWMIKNGKQKDADLAVSFVNRGVAYQLRGDYTKAAFDYQQATVLLPEYGLAWVNLGSLFELDQNPQKALKLYTYAVDRQPDFPLGWF